MARYLANERGADVNRAALDGLAPLVAATAGNHEEVITWLLKNGANAQTTYKDFGTAADTTPPRFRAHPRSRLRILQGQDALHEPRLQRRSTKKVR
jgi:hypothetical protein